MATTGATGDGGNGGAAARPSTAPPRAPLVTDVKKGSLDDGPGLRSVVFFKGCPLRCTWCQNPESFSPAAEVVCTPSRCVACGACVTACARGVARRAHEPPRRDECRACGVCVDACPAGGRRMVGRWHEPGELAALLARDEPFYRHSGGGVTLSGGEPALFPEHAGSVARLLAGRGIHVLVETCGHFDWERVARHLLPSVSTVYFDLKLADAAKHRAFTSVGNERILENLARLVALPFGDLLPRVPLVPGITDGDTNLDAIADLLVQHRLARVALLPYNPFWLHKRRGLGLDPAYVNEELMTEEAVRRCRDRFTRRGIEVAGA